MYVGEIARRYAKALAEFAQANGEEERLYREVQLIVRLWRDEKRLPAAMASPVLSAKAKCTLLTGLVGGGASKSLARFVGLVVEHGRERYLNFILHSYISLYKERHSICDATVVTASDVDDSVIERIRRSVEQSTQCRVNLHHEVNPSLLGGFTFRLDDALVDASLAAQIERLKRELGGAPNNRII